MKITIGPGGILWFTYSAFSGPLMLYIIHLVPMYQNINLGPNELVFLWSFQMVCLFHPCPYQGLKRFDSIMDMNKKQTLSVHYNQNFGHYKIQKRVNNVSHQIANNWFFILIFNSQKIQHISYCLVFIYSNPPPHKEFLHI